MLALGLLWVIYWPALHGPFVLDDVTNIPKSRLTDFSWQGLLAVIGGNDSGIFGRPVAVATFALNHALGDGTASSFKKTNLALHTVNAVLVFFFCRAVLNRVVKIHDRATSFVNVEITAALVACAWMVHPLQVSTVMYTVQRMTILMTGFTLGALIVYLRMRELQLETGATKWRFVALIGVLTLLACLSKENGALIFLYIPVLEVFLFHFTTHVDTDRRRFLMGFGAFVVLPVLVGASYFSFNTDRFLSGYALRDFDLTDRLLTETSVVVNYLRMILLPSLSEMTFYHDGFPISRELDSFVTLTVGAVVLLVVAVPVFARKAPVLALGIALFTTSHLLESTFLPLELMFEHRNYFGTAGLLLPICWYSLTATRRPRARALVGIGLASTIALLSFQTHARSYEWRTELSLNAFAVENRPDSMRARVSLAIALRNAGKTADALRHLKAAEIHDPNNAYPTLLMVQMLALEGVRDEHMIDQAIRKLARGAVTRDIARILTVIHDTHRNSSDPAVDTRSLVALYDTIVANDQGKVGSEYAAILQTHRATLLAEIGRDAEAVEALLAATELEPENVEMQLRLAERLAESGDSERTEKRLLILRNLMSPKDYISSPRVAALAEQEAAPLLPANKDAPVR